MSAARLLALRGDTAHELSPWDDRLLDLVYSPRVERPTRAYCRTHGEFLRYDFPRHLWVCPEEAVCGTARLGEHALPAPPWKEHTP